MKTFRKNESKWYIEYKTVGGDRGKEYFDSEDDAKSYYSDLVDRFHELDGEGDIEWVEEPVEESCKQNEATFKQGVDSFLAYAPEGGWSDYWAMQQDWEAFKDGLCRDGQITQKQADSWGNPCTPDTFDRWQKRNGLIRRGGWDESKKDDFNGKYYVDIEDESEETIYSSKQEFDDYESAEEWAKSELASADEDVYQASIYMMSVDADTQELDSDLEGVIYKSDVLEESKQDKKNEGHGAGYTVTIKDMEISDEPKVEYDEKKGVFTVEANVEYEANAEGYDWSTDYVMHDVIDTDEGTFPHNPYKGVLKLEITNTTDVWDSAEGLSTEEKVEDLKSSFYKGASFEDFEGSFGGGWSHSKMDDVVDVYAYTNDYGHVSIDFGKDVGIFGSLTIDERFVQNVDFSADFSLNLYELVDAVKEYLEGKGVDMDTISDESLNDVLGSWVTDDITPEYVKEVVTDALSYMDFVDANGEPVVVESKQSEADYARASKPVADAYKVLDNYYLDNGKLSDFLTEQVLMTYKNDGAMYSRSKSKAVKSHSLAWESLLTTINALLEWDDETEHATKLTSEQVKNWFKANGMDYKEALKPLVDAIENQRKEWFGESKQEESVVHELEFLDFNDSYNTSDFEKIVYDAVTRTSLDIDSDSTEQGVLKNDLIFKVHSDVYPEALEGIIKLLSGTGIVLKLDDEVKNEDSFDKTESKKSEGAVIPKVSGDAIHSKSVQTGYYTDNSGLCHIYVDGVEKDVMDFDKAVDAGYNLQESKKSEKLTQKDLKQMATSGAAIDITNVSDEEAKEIRSRKLDTVAISRGTYGMNGALLKDKEGKTYVITARNSNLFYFV